MTAESANSDCKEFSLSTEHRVYGFDELFRGGHIVWSEEYPFTMIIWGSEGSGKSTLALQLACLGRVIQLDETDAIKKNSTRCVLYYVTDPVAVPRIAKKYHDFHLDRFSDDHPVTLRHFDVEQRLAYKETSLFVCPYLGESSISAIVRQIHIDICRIIDSNGGAESWAKIDELAVVIDGIAALDLPPDKAVASDRSSKETLSKIWASMPSLHDSKQKQSVPLVVILVDESEQLNIEAVYKNRNPYLANVYIRLWQGDRSDIDKENGYCERYLQIVKAANCSHIRGPQIFRIQPYSGLEIYPNLAVYHGLMRQTYAKNSLAPATPQQEVATNTCFGHDDIDQIIYKDFGAPTKKQTIPLGSCNLLIGEAGTYKTPLALHFVSQGVLDGPYKGIFISFYNHVETVADFMQSMGMTKENDDLIERKFPGQDRFDDIKPEHRLVIQQMRSWFTPPEVFMSTIMRLIQAMKIQPGQCRIVFDAISDLHMSYPRLTGKRGFLAVLTNTLRVYGITSLFVFNESKVESAEDKVIVSLADNIFHMYKKSVAGKSSTILHIERLGNRFSGYKGVMYVRRQSKTEKGKEKIIVEKSLEAYRLDKDQQLVPASIKLYVNKRAPTHGIFNEAICQAHGLSNDQLDERLAILRGEAYQQSLQNIWVNEDKSVIMAVDEDCLRPNILCRFVDLRQWSQELRIEDKAEDKNAFCNLGACKIGDTIRVLPSLLDSTVLTCNLKILNELSSAETENLRILEDIICEAKESMQNELGRNDYGIYDLQKKLPAIPWQLFRHAADEFHTCLNHKPYRFLGFADSEELEALVVAFLDALNNFGVVQNDEELKASQEDDTQNQEKQFVSKVDHMNVVSVMSKFLQEAANIYLDDSAQSCVDKMTSENCLFYYSWHSILYSSGGRYLIPVRLVSIQEPWSKTREMYCKSSANLADITSSILDTNKGLHFVRGGYYWGILDNGLAGEKARNILQYSSNDTMNLFRIKNRVGMPPRKKFYIDTGELSIFNLGLMKSVFETCWSRTEYKNYHHMASYIRVFLVELLEYLKRQGSTIGGDRSQKELQGWLKRCLTILIPLVREENRR